MQTFTALNHYDSLERPENINPIDVNLNPSQILLSIYQLWKPLIKQLENPYTRLLDEDYEILFNEARTLLKPYKESIKNINSNDLHDIIYEIGSDPEGFRYNGIYITALFNDSEVKELTGIFELDGLGYKLEANKRLVVKKGSDMFDLGDYSQGEIINFGKVRYIGSETKDGIIINLGDVDCMSIRMNGGVHINLKNITGGAANMAYDGLYLNFGKIKNSYLAPNAKGGSQINYGLVYQKKIGSERASIAPMAYGGFQANLGSAPAMAYEVKDGMQINYSKILYNMSRRSTKGIQLNFGEVGADRGEVYDEKLMKLVTPIAKSLESKLREVEFIKELEPNDAIKVILNYDWKTFENEINEFKNKIEDILK